MKLSVHHVGGRWGTIPSIRKWKAFFPIFDVTLYEPDPGAAEQLLRTDIKRKRGYASVTVQPDCIGQYDGVADFHLCFDRNASSMLPFDPAYGDYSFFSEKHDRGVCRLDTSNRSEVTKVNVRSLGSLIAEGKISAPDLLSIDAEGVALEILKGVDAKSFENIVGLFIESTLIPYHKGESHLHHMLHYLHDAGFLCFDLGGIGRYSLGEMHIGGFDRGALSFVSDALFLKNPSRVDAPEVLEKLALVALLCGAVSVAYQCFKKLDLLGTPFAWHQPSANIGVNFLHDFYKAYHAYKDLALPKMDETSTLEAFNYFQYTDARPSKEAQQRYMSHIAATLPKYAQALAQYHQAEKNTPTHEVLYEKYALPELAEEAKAERLRHIQFLKTVLARAGLFKRVAATPDSPPQ